MQRYRLTSQAEQDVIDIWHYTSKEWGEAQADRYLRLLENGFRSITEGKVRGKQPLPHRLRVIRCEHHYVFFLSEAKPVIIAVLHEKMDCLVRLRKRLES